MKKINSLRTFTSLMIFSLVFISCKSGEKEQNLEEWTSLFNGENLDGWTIKISGHELNDNYKNTFRVENGFLKCSYDEYEQFNQKFGHIFYKDKFSHYRLRVEYRFIGDQVPEGPGWAYRNNGLMLHCQSPESMTKEQEFPVCIEVQLLGGNGTDERSTGNLCTPGTHVMMGGELITEHCISSNSKTFHGDQWVTAEVEVRGNSIIKHMINGEMVMEYNNPQLDPEAPDAKQFLSDGNIMLQDGYIALQAESHPTDFRKIEILVLSE